RDHGCRTEKASSRGLDHGRIDLREFALGYFDKYCGILMQHLLRFGERVAVALAQFRIFIAECLRDESGRKGGRPERVTEREYDLEAEIGFGDAGIPFEHGRDIGAPVDNRLDL